MNEGIQLAELKFNGRTDVRSGNDFTEPPDYFAAMVNAALVVVGKVQDKEIVEVELFHCSTDQMVGCR